MGSAATTLRNFLLAAAIAAIAGCAQREEAMQQPVEQTRPPASLARAEESFNPSEYDYAPAARREDSTTRAPETGEARPVPSTPPAAEQTPGFRVQLLSTTSIDEASARKQYAESLFPSEWFYLQYDPPTYKIRAGNFTSRLDADRFRAQIAGRGFPDAWVVPERVLKSPPPVPTREAPPPNR